MEKLEAKAKEKQFLNSMVNLSNVYSLLKAQGQNYSVDSNKYGCDPCDACGPDACAQCKGCASD